MKEIADKVGGVIVPVSEAIDMMSYFRSVSVVQKSTFRGMLEISSKIQIPVKHFMNILYNYCIDMELFKNI